MDTQRSRPVLVTGAAGHIGSAVCRLLIERGHRVRGFDLAPMPELNDAVLGNVGVQADVERAFEGFEPGGVVLHLAANPSTRASFPDQLLGPNVLGPWWVMKAAADHGAKRVAFASSLNAINGAGYGERVVPTDQQPCPHNVYGATKAWGEALGHYFAATQGIEVIAVRIGWCSRQTDRHKPGPGASRAWYLSVHDAARYFTAAVEADLPRPYAVHNLTSRRPDDLPHVGLDLTPACEDLGWAPRDVWPQNAPA